MKYWWCIFDNVLSVSGTQLGPNECIPVEVCAPVCPEQRWGWAVCGDSEKPGLCFFVFFISIDSFTSKQGTCTPSPVPSPEQMPRDGEGEKRREKKHYFPDLLISKLRSYREWYFSHCGFPVTMGSKKAFFKKSFFSQFMAEHPVANSKMK